MKTKILIEDNDVTITFSPETDLERMCVLELGDEISVSHRHKDIVLKKRHDRIRRISDLDPEPAPAPAAALRPARLIESE